MAGAGWRTFTAGAVLTAAQVQTYLQDQAVQYHASAAARSSALGTAVSAGMMSYRADGTVLEFYNGSAWTALGTGSGDVTTSGTQTLSNKTLSTAIVSGGLLETTYTTGTGFAGYTYYVTTNGGVQYITANSTANGTVNIASTSGQSLNTLMSTGQTISVVLMVTNGSTAYYPSAWQIDGSAVTPKWQGGTAPTAGNASAVDVYALAITKTASATYTVLASQTKFA
jgi:hypothetical protein